MLTVTGVDLYYGAAQALRSVSIVAEPGKVTCILGRNGVGKTSLLRALVGQQPITRGRIEWGGEDIAPACRPMSEPGAASRSSRRGGRSSPS
jgi:urea transport system ATP-binding protein